MRAPTLQTWSARHLLVRLRLQRVCTSALLFLMVATTTQPSLEPAARFSGVHNSQFSQRLKGHPAVAVSRLEPLSKTQAQGLANALRSLKSLPGNMAMISESPLQQRATLQAENTQVVHQGQGVVLGQQGTNLVLSLHDLLMPLRPLPCYRRRYCRAHALTYQSEHERVGDDIEALNLEDYLGPYARRAVVVCMDSGYDNTTLEQAIAAKQWHFLRAVGNPRRVKSARLSLTTPTSKQWGAIPTFLRHHRWLTWHTMGLPPTGSKRKRLALRLRDPMGSLRDGGRVQWVGSEPSKRPAGRRT